MLCVNQARPGLLTLLWMALLLEGCTSTLCPAAVISFTCCGARGARLSHTLMSSRRIAITLLLWHDLRWLHTQPFTLLIWPLTSRSMAHLGFTKKFKLHSCIVKRVMVWAYAITFGIISHNKSICLFGFEREKTAAGHKTASIIYTHTTYMKRNNRAGCYRQIFND